MKLDELIKELEPLPTMMTADQELEVIRKIEKVPDECILENIDGFFLLLWNLFESHTGAAIFEVNETNVGEFKAFADRLLRLAAKVKSPDDVERLKNIADAFSAQFSM